MTSRRNIAAITLVMLLCGAATSAMAQIQQPAEQEIEVDLSVLGAGPAPSGQYDPSHLPVAPRRIVPLPDTAVPATSLIGADRPAAYPVAPPPPASVVATPPPKVFEDEGPKETEIPMPPIPTAVKQNPDIKAPEENRIANFPTETNVRSESSNPALATSKPIPPPASVKATVEEKPVAPAKLEVPVAPPQQIKAVTTRSMPTADDRNRILSSPRTQQIEPIAPAAPAPVTAPNVQIAKPAVQQPASTMFTPKKRSISSEALMAASPASVSSRAPIKDLSGDKLAARLVETDKHELTRKIEEISRQVESRPVGKSSASVRTAAPTSSAPRMITVPAQPLRGPENRTETIRAEMPQVIRAPEAPQVADVKTVATKMPEPVKAPVENVVAGDEILTPLPDLAALDSAPLIDSKPAAAEKSVRVAALTKAAPKDNAPPIVLPFDGGSDKLDSVSTMKLENEILPVLNGNPGLRLQIQCFANAPDSSVSSARRLSLARGLAIRSWLMDRGVASARMDIRALGSETPGSPADRADLVFFDPLK